MPTTGDIAAKMVAALNASEPDLDTSIGTPVRKILDAVAESIAEGYTDQHLINYQYDVDSKIGGDLDDFCALFGITRIPAQRAQGVVVFSRPNDVYAQTTAVVVAPGTQALAQTNPLVYAQTIVAATLNPTQLSVDIPVQAVSAGPQGNVPAGLLNTIVTTVSGVTSCVNPAPMVGGSAQESDDQLRTRFKATVFRSLAGTQAMYQAVALAVPQDPSTPTQHAISQANVIGSSKRYREQIQLVSGAATSTLVGAAYIFPNNVYCGVDIDAGNFLVQGANYGFTPSNPTNRSDATAVVTAITGMPDGLYDLDFEYVPQSSRNDPGNTRFGTGSVNNRVDIYVNGAITDTATQSVAFSNSQRFNNTAGDKLNSAYYETSNPTAPQPVNNYIFVPLSFGPITSVPANMTISSINYVLGADYWIVRRNDAFGLTPGSAYGLVWQTTRVPANGSAFSITYGYNRVARDAQDSVNQWRLVGTDAQVHVGRQVMLKFNLAIVFDRRYDPTAVKTNIDTALSVLCASVGFGGQMQVSDVLQTVHNVAGVDNVRFLTSTDDSVTYAMTRMSVYNGTTQVTVYQAGGRAIDVTLSDAHYPVFHSTRVITKAQNTFMVGA